MKIRNGFVSNSSSSSFVVSFDKDPMILENLVEMMGECGTSLGYYDRELSTEDVVKQVHSDLLSGNAKRGDCADIDYWDYADLAGYINETISPYHDDALNWVDADAVFTDAKDSGFKTIFGREIEPYTGEFDFGYDDSALHWYYPNNGDGYWGLEPEQQHEFKMRVLGAVAVMVKVARGEIELKPERKDDTFVYTFEYSDDYSIGSMMEHGSVFRNVKYRRVSHH